MKSDASVPHLDPPTPFVRDLFKPRINSLRSSRARNSWLLKDPAGLGAVQSMWLQSRPSSSLASSSLIITSQAPAHAVQFTPQFRCFPYSASFQSLPLAQKSQLRDRGLNTVNVLHRKGTGPTDLMHLVRILNANATEWSFE